MAIEIRVESSWDTDDGEGRNIEVTVSERSHPAEDLEEDSRWFAGGDLEQLKNHICELVDLKAGRFAGRNKRECPYCGRVVKTESRAIEFKCENCVSKPFHKYDNGRNQEGREENEGD